MGGSIKTSRILCIVLFMAAISVSCQRDWKSGLTDLGFYAMSNGRVTILKFVRVEPEEDYYSLEEAYSFSDNSKSLFPNIPILESSDFLILYGDMPEGPLGTTVDVFKYELEVYELRSGDDFKKKVYRDYFFEEKCGEARDFFSMEPLDSLRGQKLFKLNIDNVEPGLYFLHKYVGLDGAALAGFQIGM